MDQAPVTSVVVEKRLPVSVFCAVTVTPGKGTLPLFTTPCSFPPTTTEAAFAGSGDAVDDVGEVGAATAGGVAGCGGAVVGASAQAADSQQPNHPPAPIPTMSLRGIRSPGLVVRTNTDVHRAAKVYSRRPNRL